MNKNRIPFSVHIATVNNDAEGVRFIRELRRNIRQSKTGRRVQIYGRGHRFGKGRIHLSKDGYTPKPGTHGFDNSYQSQLPRALATKLAVYISN